MNSLNGLSKSMSRKSSLEDITQTQIESFFYDPEQSQTSTLNVSFQNEILSFFPELSTLSKIEDYDDSIIDEKTSIHLLPKEGSFEASQNLYKTSSSKCFSKSIQSVNKHSTSSQSTSTLEDEDSFNRLNQTKNKIKNVEILIKNISSKKENKISPEKIIIEKEQRTTLLIKNVPKNYNPKELLNELLSDDCLKGKISFFYLPYDEKLRTNNRFAIINFTHPLHVILFYELFQNKKFNKYITEQNLKISYIDINFDNGFNKETINVSDDKEILIPLKYIQLFKKIYRRAVCIIKDVNIYNEGIFSVKNFKSLN